MQGETSIQILLLNVDNGKVSSIVFRVMYIIIGNCETILNEI